MKKKLWWIGAAILVGTGAFVFFRGSGTSERTDASTSSVMTRMVPVRRGPIRVTVSATGVVTPINIIEVKSKASGIVQKVPIEASDHVVVGQLIARLDQTDTRNAYDQALADSQVTAAVLTQQQNNWKRSQELFANKLMSQQDYDQAQVDYVKARTALEKAQSNLVLAEIKLAETIVLSPIDGLVLSRNVSAGQIVASAVSNVGGGTSIASLADMTEVYVVAAVDEVDIGKVSVGQEAKVVADAYSNEEFTGRVIRIAAQATVVQNVTTFDVVVLVPNRDLKLKAGMNASITIAIAHKDDVLLISNELLRDFSEMQNDRAILLQAGVVMPERRDPTDAGTQEDGTKKNFRTASKTDGSGARRADAANSKFVVVMDGEKLVLKRIHTGLSNFDDSEILDGLSDSTTTVLVRYSQAKQQSDRFKEMLKSRSGLGR